MHTRTAAHVGHSWRRRLPSHSCKTELKSAADLDAGKSPFGVRKAMLVLRGTFGVTNVGLYFAACYFLPLATATTFTFLSPLIVALLSPWLLGESPSRAVAVVIPLCIGGVVLVTQPPGLFGASAKALSTVGLVTGLLQPCFLACSKVLRCLAVSSSACTPSTSCLLLQLAYTCLHCTPAACVRDSLELSIFKQMSVWIWLVTY